MTTPFRKSSTAPDQTPPAGADQQAAAPVAGGVLTHGPCGVVSTPGEEGIAFAKRTRTYFCGRCGGPQPAWTFTWADGSKLIEG